MAGRLTLRYLPGSSVLHRWDARCKLPGLLITAMGLLHVHAELLALFSILLLAIMIFVRLPWFVLIGDLKAWAVFLLVIFVLKAFFDPEPNPPGLPWFSMSRQSISAATMTCWRLGLILAYAVLFTLVTRPREIQDALTWFMQPLPFIPARRIALMVTLTIRFLPIIIEQCEEVGLAIKARGGNLRKNPITRGKYFLLPVFRRSLIRANEIALALAARGYREDLTTELPKIPPGHAAALMCLLFLVLAGSQLDF